MHDQLSGSTMAKVSVYSINMATIGDLHFDAICDIIRSILTSISSKYWVSEESGNDH